MRLTTLALTLVAAFAVSKANGHEFWIDPTDYAVEPGGRLTADLRIGEVFEGAAMSFLPRTFERFEVIQGATSTPVEGRLGDSPALAMAGLEDGLAIIVHETTENRLTWQEWDRFLGFAEHKDFPDIAARHDARGLPRQGFREIYVRYAKSLVAVGSGAGADRQVGLLTEIVALANPYSDDLSDGIDVQVFYEGMPRMDAQVELFDRAPDGSVEVTLHRTDSNGIATLPVVAGHEYLVDAVVLEPVEPESPRDPVWLTLWASLTFAVPAR